MTAFAATVLALVSVLGETQDAEVANIVDQLIHTRRHLYLETLSPKVRDAVILRLRKTLDGSDPDYGGSNAPYNRSRAQLAFVRMEDEQGMVEYMQERHDHDAKYGASRVPLDDQVNVLPASVIPKFAEDFHLEDGEEVRWVNPHGDGEWLECPLSVSSALCVAGAIQYSPVFAPEVREWAAKLFRTVGCKGYDYAKSFNFKPRSAVQFRQIMREWWRENEAHFASRDYAAVTPGAELPETKPPENTKPTAGMPALPSVPAAPANPNASLAASTESESSPYLIPAAIGFSLLAVGAGAVLLRRNKSG